MWAVRKEVPQITIRKFADLQYLLYFRTFRQSGNLRICDLRTQFFGDLRPIFFMAICGLYFSQKNSEVVLPLGHVKEYIIMRLNNI
jgi:hypothetical protein